MTDSARRTRALSDFARTLILGHDVYDVLHDLTQRVTELLGTAGAAVSLLRDGRLRFVTADSGALAALEQAEDEHGDGPGGRAARAGAPVLVSDLFEHRTAWPRYVRTAEELGVRSVASLPLRTDTDVLGTLDLYSMDRRNWSEDDVAVANVLADMATAFMRNASELQSQRRLNEQLQRALDTRVVIEQAKGIVAASHGIGIEEAFRVLRKHANDHHASLRSVATAVVQLGLRP